MTKRKDLIKILRAHGFSYHGGTNHEKFKNKDGLTTFVPRHNELDYNTCVGILKEVGISKDELRGK